MVAVIPWLADRILQIQTTLDRIHSLPHGSNSYLPKFGSNLVTALSSLYVNDFSHDAVWLLVCDAAAR